jgi:ATP-dependent RNA helicase DeaD
MNSRKRARSCMAVDLWDDRPNLTHDWNGMTQDFQGFGLSAKLLQALDRMKFTAPTPVQAEAIPLALAGSDILGTAQTGTGKTGAFGIPLIAKLMEHPAAQALVMTPTRELAAQVMAALQQMIPVPTIKTALLIGGEAMPRQFRQLDQHPRLIVGTPGRITDHLMRGSLKLAQARFLVLDETDRMLDMGFGPQIDKIMQYMPAERQTMMFSATLPENIIRMSRKYLKEPKRIAIGSTIAPILKIKQELIKMGEGEKYQHLLVQLGQRAGSVLIFVKTKYGTEKLADKLNRDQHHADAIHGDLQQRRRDRVIQGFRDKRYRVLVATDVAARGLDIPHIEHVINYDLPQCPEDYIHRIGRTARAGAEGSAVNFLTTADHAKWNAIHRLMNPGAASSHGERPASDARHRGPPRKRWGGGGGNRGHGGGGGNYHGAKAASSR